MRLREMVSYINKVNFSNIKLNPKRHSFDAGIKTYNIILNQTRIKLSQKADTELKSDDPNVSNLVDLIDKYVGLAYKLINK